MHNHTSTQKSDASDNALNYSRSGRRIASTARDEDRKRSAAADDSNGGEASSFVTDLPVKPDGSADRLRHPQTEQDFIPYHDCPSPMTLGQIRGWP